MADNEEHVIYDDLGRRKWDKKYYVAKSQEIANASNTPVDKAEEKRKRLAEAKITSTLKRREGNLNLDAIVGKTKTITSETPLSQQGGYYCKVCDCLLHDSAAYLDHINGKNHQRLLGMSMHTERSTLSDVKKKFASLKRKQRDPVQEAEELFKKQKMENEKRKLNLKMKRKGNAIPPPPPEKKNEEKPAPPKEEKKVDTKEEKPEMSAEDEAMMQLLGFSGFGSTKQ